MPQFVFTLQPLLDMRLRQEQQVQRALAQVNVQRVQIEQKLRRQQQIITADKDGLRGRLVGVLDTDELRGHASATVQGIRAAQQSAVELAGVHKRLQAIRAALIEATRARRAIELLRNRRLQQWKNAQNRAETAAMDELAVIAAARQEHW